MALEIASTPRRALGAVALLALGACVRVQSPAPSIPAPLILGVEELGENPKLTASPVVEVERDLLGGVIYDLPVVANSWVAAELDFLVGERREVIGRWIERGEAYEEFVKAELAAQGVPTDLYHLAMIESGFQPTVRSRAGAVGMWQFMPATGRQMGLKVDREVDERMDPVRATRAAARHLRDLHRGLGNWPLAAAAYNAGPGRVTRGLRQFGATDFWDLAQRGDLAEETRRYVPRLYAMTIITRDRERFGFAPTGASAFAFDSVHVEYATPLGELAKMGAAGEEELKRLNPHLLRGITPDGGYWVWVPAGSGESLQRAYLASDFRRERGYGTYVVRKGDYLGRIAERADVRAARIREMNPGVDFDRLQIGERLRLPYRAALALNERPEPREEAPRAAAREPDGYVASRAEGAVHTVAWGETLSGIARTYGVPMAEIRRENGIDGETIIVGQRLRIPATATRVAAAERASHTVENGDTLWGLARRYSSSVAAIREANDLGDRPIRPGQTLTIPRSR